MPRPLPDMDGFAKNERRSGFGRSVSDWGEIMKRSRSSLSRDTNRTAKKAGITIVLATAASTLLISSALADSRLYNRIIVDSTPSIAGQSTAVVGERIYTEAAQVMSDGAKVLSPLDIQEKKANFQLLENDSLLAVRLSRKTHYCRSFTPKMAEATGNTMGFHCLLDRKKEGALTQYLFRPFGKKRFTVKIKTDPIRFELAEVQDEMASSNMERWIILEASGDSSAEFRVGPLAGVMPGMREIHELMGGTPYPVDKLITIDLEAGRGVLEYEGLRMSISDATESGFSYIVESPFNEWISLPPDRNKINTIHWAPGSD